MSERDDLAGPTVPTIDPMLESSHQSTGALIAQLTDQASDLMRQELRLAQAEIQKKVKQFALGTGLLGAAGLTALYGLGVLIAAGILALALVLPAWLAALLVGVLLFVIAGTLALVGKTRVGRATPLAPNQAVDNVKRDIAAVKGDRS